MFTPARFSAAFLILRAQQSGIPLATVPLVLVAVNLVYALSACPLGRISNRASHKSLLIGGLALLIAADLIPAGSALCAVVLAGVAVWGVHMGMTQGLLAVMVADTAPADLRGTAYGFFNLVSGVAHLIASLVAGLLWDNLGAPATFLTGALFSAAALVLLFKRGGNRPASRGALGRKAADN